MFWSAAILGFLGSLHCVIMCGPIALAMPGQKTLNRFLLSRVLYNFGRVLTYAIIGLTFGLLGELIGLSGYQQAFSIALGIIMILLAFSFSSQWFTSKPTHWMTRWSNLLRYSMRHWIKNTSIGGSLLLGIANGFLPCGLVYAAVVGAISFVDIGNGVQYMISFGLGTFPAMIVVAMSGQLFKRNIPSFSSVSSVLVLILGIMLTLRGLNLDIPYLSPAITLLYPDISSCN